MLVEKLGNQTKVPFLYYLVIVGSDEDIKAAQNAVIKTNIKTSFLAFPCCTLNLGFLIEERKVVILTFVLSSFPFCDANTFKTTSQAKYLVVAPKNSVTLTRAKKN